MLGGGGRMGLHMLYIYTGNSKRGLKVVLDDPQEPKDRYRFIVIIRNMTS